MERAASIQNDTYLDDFALRRVSYRAKSLADQLRLSAEDREDLQQDMIVTLLEAATAFDPAKAGHHTFIERILDRFSMRFLRDAVGRQEHACWDPDAYDELEDEEPIDRKAAPAILEDRLDVRSVIDQMPAELQLIALTVMKCGNVPEAAEALGMTQTGFQCQLERMREYFSKAGFDPFGQG